MSQEDFIKRWSRRKQEAAAEQRPRSSPADAMAERQAEPVPEAESNVDLSKLPPLDSITAATDITDFLQKGIPAELSRAALRRAWAADPAIRDFVGLAENAWDFTDPGSIPGFGTLDSTPDQIAKMVEQVFSHGRETAEKLATDLSRSEKEQQTLDSGTAISSPQEAPQTIAFTPNDPSQQVESDAAAQPENRAEDGDDVPILRRTHGGALPT